MSKYDWIIVGGGIAGISICEMLSRLGKKCLILESKDKLASGNSGDFHEWLHTGALYTLLPDRLLTTSYLLGAIDDLMSYYSGYANNNLKPTESGLIVDESGWFNSERIRFRYRNRRFNPIWQFVSAKSMCLINEIDSHDWLRKRAGSFRYESKVYKNLLKHYPRGNKQFKEIKSSDISMNSRLLISDLCSVILERGSKIIFNSEVESVSGSKGNFRVSTSCSDYRANNVVFTAADSNAKFTNRKVTTSFAPMMVVNNLEEDAYNFVELDYNTKKCINLIKKGNDVGLAGGISLSNENQIDSYLEFCKKEHQRLNPNIKVIGTYVGVKKEIVRSGQNRNYLYHIIEENEGLWSVNLGKFTLAFSMAPEFIRRVYSINPPKYINYSNTTLNQSNIISQLAWERVLEKYYGSC